MRLIACVIVLLLGSACSRTETGTSQDASAAATGAPAVDVEQPMEKLQAQSGVQLLEQEGITFDFPHAINYDIVDKNRRGTPRHRVLVEARGGDFDKIARGFTTSLAHMGYKKKKESNAGGRIRATYAAKGRPTLYLRMQPLAIGPKLKSKDAVGSIHVMWNAR